MVHSRPRNSAGWEALIKCLYQARNYDEAEKHAHAAFEITNGKPVFIFYLSGIQFAQGRTKEALLTLEKAMDKAPKLLKKLMLLNPSLLQHQQVVDIIARFKKNR